MLGLLAADPQVPELGVGHRRGKFMRLWTLSLESAPRRACAFLWLRFLAEIFAAGG